MAEGEALRLAPPASRPREREAVRGGECAATCGSNETT